mmetsp:Transcript_49771/g.105832  ORF Transcript_49771/g.105832 Transcript_49771/m.105832 type:complete len:206 (+) Transcript_49771:1369-1986(+)
MMRNPRQNPTAAGTRQTVLQACSADMPSLKSGKRTVPMTIWVTPPPRLPQPPTSALAVPATSLVNMREVQNWQQTKVDPPSPMKKRRPARDAALLMRPVQAQGMEHAIKRTPIRIRAPYLSHMGPLMNRMNTVPATEQMLDVQICCFEIFSVSLISGRRGAMANQMKKAVKNPIHEQWKARMCGRLKERSLISVALSSWSGSTLT